MIKSQPRIGIRFFGFPLNIIKKKKTGTLNINKNRKISALENVMFQYFLKQKDIRSRAGTVAVRLQQFWEIAGPGQGNGYL